MGGGGDVPRVGAGAFRRGLTLPGWSMASSWGFDAELECFWAELWPADAEAGPVVRVSREHLVPTVTGLARAVGAAVGVPADDAFLALTA